jgi:peptidyl-Asp metalloendopeptidase
MSATILRGVPAPHAALLLVGLCLFALAATGASAQSAPAAKAAADTDRLIVSNVPAQGSRLHRLLAKLIGRAKKRALGLTRSEVWHVPKARSQRLVERLVRLGVKVTTLREDWNHILKRYSHPFAMSPRQEDVVAHSRAAPETVGIGLMKAPEAAIAEYALTGEGSAGGAPEAVSTIVLPINDNQSVTVQRLQVTSSAEGYTWNGIVQETGESSILMWWKDGRLTGVLGYKGHIYTVVNIGGEAHAVIEVDPRKMPPDHAAASTKAAERRAQPNARSSGKEASLAAVSPAPPAPPIPPFADAERTALEAKNVTIDAMIVYTKKVASRYIRDPADLIALAVAQANQALANSGVGNVKLRLVHTQLIDYDESSAQHFEHLYRMVDGLGPFREIHRLRDDKRADVVGMIIDDPSGCGLSTRVGPDAEDAYFVVHHSCAAVTISIAHEIGHILGARHDRRIDAGNTPFAFGHGYVNGTKWRTMMSYQESCDGCLRIPYWSNPRVLYKGEPTGTADADNARVILEQAERVSKFR